MVVGFRGIPAPRLAQVFEGDAIYLGFAPNWAQALAASGIVLAIMAWASFTTLGTKTADCKHAFAVHLYSSNPGHTELCTGTLRPRPKADKN